MRRDFRSLLFVSMIKEWNPISKWLTLSLSIEAIRRMIRFGAWRKVLFSLLPRCEGSGFFS